jgi:hypothetical protein
VERIRDVEVKVGFTDDFPALLANYQGGVFDGITCGRVNTPNRMDHVECVHATTTNYLAVYIDSDDRMALVMCEVMPIGEKGSLIYQHNLARLLI